MITVRNGKDPSLRHTLTEAKKAWGRTGEHIPENRNQKKTEPPMERTSTISNDICNKHKNNPRKDFEKWNNSHLNASDT